MRRLLALVAVLALTACGGLAEDELGAPDGEETTREVAAARTCTVAAESVAVRTCWASGGETGGTRNLACGPVGPIFATQAVRSALSLASIASPVDADEKLLGSRLESLGLIIVAGAAACRSTSRPARRARRSRTA